MTAVSPRTPPLVQPSVAGGRCFREPPDLHLRSVPHVVPGLLALRPGPTVLLAAVLVCGSPGEPEAVSVALPADGTRST